MLIETAQTEFGIPADIPASRVSCETGDAVNDVRIDFGDDYHLYGQCKKNVRISESTSSKFADLLIQLHQQFQQGSNHRNVLFHQGDNQNLKKLGTILSRARSMPTGNSVMFVASGVTEIALVERVYRLIDTLDEIPNASKDEFLKSIHIKQLKLEEGDSDWQSVCTAVKVNVLSPLSQARWNAAVNWLLELSRKMTDEQAGIDRADLREKLTQAGYELNESPSYREDFEKMSQLTNDQIHGYELNNRASIKLQGKTVKVERAVTQDIVRCGEKHSFLVVGDAGSGKTGALFGGVQQLSENRRVWFWSASSIKFSSLQEAKNIIGLQHSWIDVLKEAASTDTILVIDGLDSIRDGVTLDSYVELLRYAKASGVTVIASVRTFDLRYSTKLIHAFHASEVISENFTNEELAKIAHIQVPELHEDEIKQVIKSVPQVGYAIKKHDQLAQIVTNIFSLKLLCELLDSHIEDEELSTISTQAELFDRYWEERVQSFVEECLKQRNEVEDVVSLIINEMVSKQRLQVALPVISAEVKQYLMSTNLLSEVQSMPGRLPDDRVGFTHDLLFDYLAEKFFVRPKKESLVGELSSYDNWGLFLRPSLIFFYRWAWHKGRNELWDILNAIQSSDAVPHLQKFPGYVAIATEVRSVDDLDHPFQQSLSDKQDSDEWRKLLFGVITAATYVCLPKQIAEGTGQCWLDLALKLAQSKSDPHVRKSYQILQEANGHIAQLTDDQKRTFNQAVVALIEYLWTTEEPMRLISRPITWLCHSFASNPVEAAVIVRKIIEPVEIVKTGYIQAQQLSWHIDGLWDADPALVAKVYSAMYGYEERDESTTGFSNSVILSISSNRRQDYTSGLHFLQEKFDGFLHSSPKYATMALINVSCAYSELKDRDLPAVQLFLWNGKKVGVLTDYSHIWDHDDNNREETSKMLGNWQQFLANEITEDQWKDIQPSLVTEKTPASVWRRLLTAGASNPRFYAKKLSKLICIPQLLMCVDLMHPIGQCFMAFQKHLGDKFVDDFQKAVLSLKTSHAKYLGYSHLDEYVKRQQAKYLSLIPKKKRTDAAKSIVESFEKEDVKIDEDRGYSTVRGVHFSREEELAREGISLTNKANKDLDKMAQEIGKLAAKVGKRNLAYLQKKLSDAESYLNTSSDADPKLRSIVQNEIVNAYLQIVRSFSDLKQDISKKAFDVFRTALEKELNNPVDAKEVDQYNEVVTYGSIDPRYTATSGLMYLVWNKKKLDSAYLELLKKVAHADDPQIGFHLASKIFLLQEKSPLFVLDTLEKWLDDLPNRARNYALLSAVLHNGFLLRTRKIDASRADAFAQKLLQTAKDLHLNEWQQGLGRTYSSYSITEQWKWIEELTEKILEAPEENAHTFFGFAEGALDYSFPRRMPKHISVTDAQAKRAHALLLRILAAGNSTLHQYRERVLKMEPNKRPSEPPTGINTISRTFEIASTELHFLAKAKVEEWNAGKGNPAEEISKFWKEQTPLLNILCEMAHPAIAYDVLQAIEELLPFNTKIALSWLRKMTLAALPNGITYEHMASDKTVELLERIFADHKSLLAEDEQAREDFLLTLDAYLEIGWERAIQMAIQIEGIYR